MGKDILTTSETAKLLGVSVRTAQLFIEGGELSSWKTPGGHRRVYRSDVLQFMARKNPAAFHSARVFLLASAERLPALEQSLAAVAGCTVESFSDPFAASFSMGLRNPAAVIVDLADDARKHLSFLEYLALNPTLGHTKLIALGHPPREGAALISSRLHAQVSTPQALADAVRTALQDDSRPAAPFPAAPAFPVAPNEAQRLAALTRSGLLESGPEEAFDQLTWLASHSLKSPVALVTLLTPTHQHFKSRHGLALTETPRSWAFCNYTILQKGVFTVGNLAEDERFAANPAVMNEPHFRFYAGAPILDPDGFALASLCVIDYEPRILDTDQTQTLQLLAKFASGEIRSRATSASLSPGRAAAH